MEAVIQEATRMFGEGASIRQVQRATGLTRYKARQIRNGWAKEQHGAPGDEKKRVEKSFDGDAGTITTRSADIRTLEQALDAAEVDLETWEVDRHVVNSWEVTMSAKAAGGDAPQTYTNFQVKVWLKRKSPAVRSLEVILAKIESQSLVVPEAIYPVARKGERRILEVAIFDPHLGLRCYAPGADLPWTLDMCEKMCMAVLGGLLKRASLFGPFEHIVFPFGNDLMHADNVWHTTTGGTPQPESDAYQHVWERAESLSVGMVEALKLMAPVKGIVVPGNHARQSEFAMGRFLRAYYRNDANVEFDASSSPYKFHHYGVNLIGYEHGHSVTAIRLAALMANETRTSGWADARYCEWHLGDQHRKGSSKPSMLEEQGVSVEYLPGLTPPNEWHRIKSFNWQKRAGMAFVWDHDAGPIARLQVNLDNYTGELMEKAK